MTGLPFGEPCFPIDERFYPLDFTEFVLEDKTEFSAEFARLYQQGHSIKEIADHYGCSKNKVRSLLIDAGLTLRERHAQATHQRSITSGKQVLTDELFSTESPKLKLHLAS